MASSKKASATSTEDRSHEVGESIGDLGAATADLGKEAQQQVSNLTEQVRQQATEQLTSQKDRAVDTLETVALLLHQAGEHAQQQDKALLANYVDKAAQQVGTFSESIAQQDVTQIVQTTKDFARREPMLFVGGALAAGFLGARFLRSSSEQSTNGSTSQNGSGEATTELPAYDMDQGSTASSEGVLGATSPAPSDAMEPDATGFMHDYETAVLESSDIAIDGENTILPDLDDIERAENL